MSRSSRICAGLAIAALGVACHSGGAPARSPADNTKRAKEDASQELTDASQVLREVLAMPEGVPVRVRQAARCVAVIPGAMKAAAVLGARWGRGVASCRTASSWSAPAFFELSGASLGLQLGVQSTDLVLYVMNDTGKRKLLEKVDLGATASAAAGPVGREAGAGTDWTLRSELLTYSRARGLFAGIDLGGVVLTHDRERTDAMYGGGQDYRELLDGRVLVPEAASDLVSQLVAMSAATTGPAAAR